MSERPQGWYGVDLDGTLAFYDVWRGTDHIGEPIPLMLVRVKKWIEQGIEVRIFTARVSGPRNGRDMVETTKSIENWCLKHVGKILPVTCVKDFGLIQLWDDRAVGVVPNAGLRADGVID